MNNTFKRLFLRDRNTNGEKHSALNINANIKSNYPIGFILVSLGVFLAASSGSWDITNHLLNKPETFFSPPHLGLYTGVGLVVFGAIWILCYSHYTNSGIACNNVDGTKPHYTKLRLPLPIKLIFIGVAMLVVAGPFDFAWHSAFGLDGLLSPSHLTLTVGMVMSSIGAFVGILSVSDSNLFNHKTNKIKSIMMTIPSSIGHPSVLLVIGIVPVWITLVGLTHMLSLPFSDTEYFNFNPDPILGAIIATLAFPFLVSFILSSSFQLTRKFGVLSITGSIFIFINLITSILPNEHLHSTVSFYLLNLIPFLGVDILLSSKLSIFNNNTAIYGISGAILGLTFFMLYYPLITYTYNEVLPNPQAVWPSLTVTIYFEMIGKIYPVVALPALTMGILGAILAPALKRNQLQIRA